MWALTVATIYFGTFLVIGWLAKRVLDPRPIVSAQDYLEHVSQQWDTALARLKALVEKT